MIPPTFVQNVDVMYIEILFKFQRFPDTQSRVITKVYAFLGQPSYVYIGVLFDIPVSPFDLFV